MHAPTLPSRPLIRRLWTPDLPLVVDFFVRLTPSTRRARFGAAANDRYVTKYAQSVFRVDTVVYGAFVEGQLCGVAELRGITHSWQREAEIGIVVAPAQQDEGVGDALLGRLIAAAQNRRVRTVHMICLPENKRMQSLARKHKAVLAYDIDNVEARLDPPWPTPVSLVQEMMVDPRSYLHAVFQLLP